MKKLTTEEARKFNNSIKKWTDYKKIEDYVEDIVVSLIYSSWHYTEKRAREQCEERMIFIEQSFKEKLPAFDCATDVGYNCG